ncbi:MAG: glutathione peroxidase [Pikeienuella sp.]
MLYFVKRYILAVIIMAGGATQGLAEQDFVFKDIDGGEIRLSDFRGGPVLVVNTASRCGFTYQYEGLQTLYEQYKDKGLTVLAVPSNAFRQELSNNEAVKDFCEVNYGLTIPMTEVTVIKGADAHPFYQWLKAEHRFTPRWNFNKVLLDGEGAVVETYGSGDRPGTQISRDVAKLLE